MSAKQSSNQQKGAWVRADPMGPYTYEVLNQKESVTTCVTPVQMKTGFLFADPSVWTGAGRLLDIGCTFDIYNYSQTDKEADAKAIYSDWAMVGGDIMSAMEYYDQW